MSSILIKILDIFYFQVLKFLFRYKNVKYLQNNIPADCFGYPEINYRRVNLRSILLKKPIYAYFWAMSVSYDTAKEIAKQNPLELGVEKNLSICEAPVLMKIIF